MKKICLEQGIEKYGTPSYVFDMDILGETVKWFREMLQQEAGLCYAMKANPFLTKEMQEKVDRIEVCSMGEFRICKELKIPPERLLISGVLKKKEDLFEILDCFGGACMYTVESLSQFHDITAWCDDHKRKIDIFLRLSSGNQFGMDKETIQNIVDVQNKDPYVSVLGIHFFSGTQKKSIEKIIKEFEELDQYCVELEKSNNIEIKELEYGPGIFVSYFEGQNNNVEEEIKNITTAIANRKWRGKVTLEMGRGLSARCGYYMTSIRDVKKTNNRRYCIVDGGMNQINYDGQIRGMYVPKFYQFPERTEGEKEEYTVCGPLCTANDVLIQKAILTEPKEGDVLVFKNTGAYAMTEGMALFLSHALPKIIFYCKLTGFRTVREKKSTYILNMEKEITKDE